MSTRSELENVLITWAAAQVPPIPVSLEGVPFTKPTSGKYVQAFMLPSATTNPTLDMKRKRVRGFFQVNCYSPDGQGSAAVEALADAVAALYPSWNKLAFPTTSIEQHPQTGQAIIDGTFRFVPVTIKYRVES